jgi:DNA-binding transcriptional LysR family regulator
MSKEAAKDAIGVTENDTLTSSCNWDDLRIFGLVARAGSFRKASDRLGIQVPTLSRRIDALEHKLGQKLFDRTPRGLLLTEPGRRIFADVESIEMIMQGPAWRGHTQEEEVRREVKLMMSEGLADRWFVPNFLNLFLEREEGTTIRLGTSPETGDTAIPPFDLQIQYGPATQGNLNTVRVGTFHMMYFASQSYIDRYGLPQSQSDLTHHRFADAMPSLTAKQGVMSTYSNVAGYSRAALISNSGLAMANAVEAGAVIALLPTYIFLTSPAFVPVLSDLHYQMGIYVNYSQTSAERAEVRMMIDFLKGVVFDRRRMPWFADTFECPREDWRAKFRGILAAHTGKSLH